MQDDIHFDLDDIQRVFNEAQLTFPDQLVRDYDDLVEFNRRILTERQRSPSRTCHNPSHGDRHFREQANADSLGNRRREILQVLGGTDSLQKFKDLQRQIDQDRANLA